MVGSVNVTASDTPFMSTRSAVGTGDSSVLGREGQRFSFMMASNSTGVTHPR